MLYIRFFTFARLKVVMPTHHDLFLHHCWNREKMAIRHLLLFLLLLTPLVKRFQESSCKSSVIQVKQSSPVLVTS